MELQISKTLQPVGHYTEQSYREATRGFDTRRADFTRQRALRVMAASELMADVITGQAPPEFLREAFNPSQEYILAEINRRYPGALSMNLRETVSVSDYAALTIDVLDRLLYGYYDMAPVPNKGLVKMRPGGLRDFRIVKRFMMDGATKPFVKTTPGAPPLQRAMTQVDNATNNLVNDSTAPGSVTYQPFLYQGYMSVNWEAIVNDDLGVFNDMMMRLAVSGNNTIWDFITKLYFDASGPNANLFNDTFGNIITIARGAAVTNPPLSFEGIQDGKTILMKQADTDGQPIMFPGNLILVVGPALAQTAQAMKMAASVDLSVRGGNQNTQGFPTSRLRSDTNYVMGDVDIVVDKRIPLVVTASGVKDTSWLLVYDPTVQPRPACEMGFLQSIGETPQLLQRAPNTIRPGGGVDPTLGDFLSMDQDYKAITVFGGSQIDGRSAVSSTGAGS